VLRAGSRPGRARRGGRASVVLGRARPGRASGLRGREQDAVAKPPGTPRRARRATGVAGPMRPGGAARPRRRWLAAGGTGEGCPGAGRRAVRAPDWQERRGLGVPGRRHGPGGEASRHRRDARVRPARAGARRPTGGSGPRVWLGAGGVRSPAGGRRRAC